MIKVILALVSVSVLSAGSFVAFASNYTSEEEGATSCCQGCDIGCACCLEGDIDCSECICAACGCEVCDAEAACCELPASCCAGSSQECESSKPAKASDCCGDCEICVIEECDSCDCTQCAS